MMIMMVQDRCGWVGNSKLGWEVKAEMRGWNLLVMVGFETGRVVVLIFP